MKNTIELTPREFEVKELILQGYTNKEIAKELFVSVHTAKSHVCSVINKLEVKNRFGIFIKEIENLKLKNRSVNNLKVIMKGANNDNK